MVLHSLSYKADSSVALRILYGRELKNFKRHIYICAVSNNFEIIAFPEKDVLKLKFQFVRMSYWTVTQEQETGPIKLSELPSCFF